MASTKVSLVVNDFSDVEDEAVLREIHDHLFRKHNLLDRVIKARKLHHSHFYAVDNDYGHEKYLTKLLNDKHVAAQALERLGRRGAAVKYKKKQWYDWVKQCQQAEESQRESESRKVKLESMLLGRHKKEAERHQRELKAKEKEQLQDKHLEEAYQQRLQDMSDEDQEEWDPIRDIYGYERDNYIDLINYFLMVDNASNALPEPEFESESSKPSGVSAKTLVDNKVLSKSAKKRAKKANSEMKKLADPASRSSQGQGSAVIEMETKSQMRERLAKPITFERPTGWYFGSSVQDMSPDAQTYPLPDAEINSLLEEVREVKNYLFCRILLSQASLLPVALESESIEQFLADERVTRDHLRDLCLKLERPILQDVRDACADFSREDHEDDDGAADINEEEQPDAEEGTTGLGKNDVRLFKRKGRIPDKYNTKREKAARKKQKNMPSAFNDEAALPAVDFGKTIDESDYRQKRTRIRVCGRTMYNYPSEKALNRGGWFHFSIIAKDSDLNDAIALCRNWNEFFELNVLCLHHYFPAAKWLDFSGDLLRQSLLNLGFIPYFMSTNADRLTQYFQTGSRGMARRSHQIFEMRNVICGHIKRDDPISRRFIQYLSMETWELRALVRDPKTGDILIKPPEDELWL